MAKDGSQRFWITSSIFSIYLQEIHQTGNKLAFSSLNFFFKSYWIVPESKALNFYVGGSDEQIIADIAA